MNKEKVELLKVVALYILIILLLVTIIVLVKNINEIKTNPIAYGVEKYNLQECYCHDLKGNIYSFDKGGIIKRDGDLK